MNPVPILAATAVLSCALTGMARRLALAHGVLDHPTDRSSHVVPTPRGGGIAILACVFAAVLTLRIVGQCDDAAAAAVLGAGSAVGGVGLLDDRLGLAPWSRLAVHFGAATWAVAWLGVPPLHLGGVVWPEVVTFPLAVIALVWLINLFNFMDGINGIASVEAVLVCGAASLIQLANGASAESILSATVAVAALGFLPWNFPRARIFMGDAGSGFLGISIGCLALIDARIAPHRFGTWLILLSVFIVDATVTLLVRAMRSERLSHAHRSHAYQRAARGLGSHAKVVLGVALINIVCLTPIAWLVSEQTMDPRLGVIAAWGLVTLAVVWWGAGRTEASD